MDSNNIESSLPISPETPIFGNKEYNSDFESETDSETIEDYELLAVFREQINTGIQVALQGSADIRDYSQSSSVIIDEIPFSSHCDGRDLSASLVKDSGISDNDTTVSIHQPLNINIPQSGYVLGSIYNLDSEEDDTCIKIHVESDDSVTARPSLSSNVEIVYSSEIDMRYQSFLHHGSKLPPPVSRVMNIVDSNSYNEDDTSVSSLMDCSNSFIIQKQDDTVIAIIPSQSDNANSGSAMPKSQIKCTDNKLESRTSDNSKLPKMNEEVCDTMKDTNTNDSDSSLPTEFIIEEELTPLDAGSVFSSREYQPSHETFDADPDNPSSPKQFSSTAHSSVPLIVISETTERDSPTYLTFDRRCDSVESISQLSQQFCDDREDERSLNEEDDILPLDEKTPENDTDQEETEDNINDKHLDVAVSSQETPNESLKWALPSNLGDKTTVDSHIKETPFNSKNENDDAVKPLQDSNDDELIVAESLKPSFKIPTHKSSDKPEPSGKHVHDSKLPLKNLPTSDATTSSIANSKPEKQTTSRSKTVDSPDESLKKGVTKGQSSLSVNTSCNQTLYSKTRDEIENKTYYASLPYNPVYSQERSLDEHSLQRNSNFHNRSLKSVIYLSRNRNSHDFLDDVFWWLYGGHNGRKLSPTSKQEQWVRIFNRLEPRHQNYIVGKQREFEQKAMANEYGTQNVTPVLYSSSSTNRTQDHPPSRQISSSANTPINYQSDMSRQYEEQIQGIHSQYKAKILRMEQLADQKTKMLEKEFQLTKLECQNHERRIADLLDERENYAIHIASLNEANGQLKREYNTVIERLKMSQENYVQLKTKMEQMESNSSSKCDKDVLQQILDDYNRLSREHEAFKRTALQFQHSADRQMQDLEKDNVELRNENAKLRQQLKVMEFTEHVNNASIHGQNRFSDDFHVVRNHNRQIGSGNFSPGDPRDSKSLYQLEKEYSSLEKQFDDLQLEKSAVESRLSCLGGSGFAKVGCRSVPVREERDRLEDKLEKINAELSALRLAMRQNKNFRKM